MLTNTALAKSPEKVAFVGKGDASATTVGFEFEFICPSSKWRNLPRLVSDKLGPVGEVSKEYGAHQDRKDYLTKWHITGDSSITGYPLGSSSGKEPDQEDGESDEAYADRLDEAIGHTAVELVSPILASSDTDKVLRSVFEVIAAVDGYTNSSCGFHITIGNDRISSYMDPIKFAVFLGDRKIISRFGREGNRHASSLLDYAESMLDADYYDAIGDEPEDREDYEDDYDESDFKQEIRATPFEHMRDELLSSCVNGRGYIHHDRAAVLEALTKLGSESKDDRYMSVNLQKAKMNLVEYRAVGGDYLKSLSALQHITKRAVYAVLVSVGRIDTPDIEKAYARYLLKTFSSAVPRPGVKPAQANDTNLKPMTFNFTVDAVREDSQDAVYLDVRATARGANYAKSTSPVAAIDVLVRIMQDGKAIGSISAGFEVTKKPSGEWEPRRGAMKYNVQPQTAAQSPLSHAQLAHLLKVLRSILLNPLNVVWRKVDLAAATILRSQGLSLEDSLSGIRVLRTSLFSTFTFYDLSKLAAELVVKWMTAPELDSRYPSNKNSQVQRVRAELENAVYTNAFRTAVYGVANVNYMGDYTKDLIQQKIKHPLNLVPPEDKRIHASADETGLGFSIETQFAVLACGYISSVEQFAQSILNELELYDFSLSITHSKYTPQQLSLKLIATVAGLLYRCSIERSRHLPNTASMEAAAYEYAEKTGRATREFVGQLTSVFKPARDTVDAVYAKDAYLQLWNLVIPSLHNNQFHGILRGVDVLGPEYNLFIDTYFQTRSPGAIAWKGAVSELLNR